jgi:predicted dehydrogenase
MKFLVIGLGSMGKRRIRNLRELGFFDISGLDSRSDRRDEVEDQYGIKAFADLNLALQDFNPDVFIICTSPDAHMEYAYFGVKREIHVFIEASVVDSKKIKQLIPLKNNSKVIVAPSCTMKYFPGPIKIKELIQAEVIGKVHLVNYHVGQSLRDWHPWEEIEDYYVSKKLTGGAREIVPFELTWLNDIFGKPIPISAWKAKLSKINAPIDDTYFSLINYDNDVMVNMTVEVIANPIAVRKMLIVGENGLIEFDSQDNSVRYIVSGLDNWIECKLAPSDAYQNYINPEAPYVLELRDFIAAVREKNADLFPNSLLSDYNVLLTLNEIEKISEVNMKRGVVSFGRILATFATKFARLRHQI